MKNRKIYIVSAGVLFLLLVCTGVFFMWKSSKKTHVPQKEAANTEGTADGASSFDKKEQQEEKGTEENQIQPGKQESQANASEDSVIKKEENETDIVVSNPEGTEPSEDKGSVPGMDSRKDDTSEKEEQEQPNENDVVVLPYIPIE